MAKLSTWLTRRTHAVPPLSDRELAETFRSALSAVLDGDHGLAEEQIAKAVRSDSDDVEPYRALAKLYRLRGEIGRAIQIHQNLLLRRGLEARVRNDVLGELAGDFRQGGFLSRALAAYREVLGNEPKNPVALRAASELLGETGDYAEALALTRRLARVEKRRDSAAEANLLMRMAEASHSAGEHDAARKTLKKALRRDSTSAEARILLGELEAERGKNKAALAAWREVVVAGGRDAARVHPLVDASYAALGRPRDYEKFLRELLDDRPADAVARTALARTLSSRGESASAVLELRRVLDLSPDDVVARIELGRVLISENLQAHAVKEFGELLEWLAQRSERFAQVAVLGEGQPAAPREGHS
jgi:lipopolysaccharide biosynthesis regulator YciM